MNTTLLLYSLAIFFILVATQDIFHRYARFSFFFFVIASIIFFPCWILLIGVDDWFQWLKVLSIATGIIVLSLFRTTRLGNTKWCQWTIWIFLVVNILEAVMRDVTSGELSNYLNAAAGILLVLTLSKVSSIHIDKKYKDLSWASMTMAWIIGYTIWNWVFVYLNFGYESSIQHIAVLGSALLTAFFQQERWLQARVFTLGTYFLLIHSAPHLAGDLFTNVHNEAFGLFMAVIAFVFMAAYAIYFYSQKMRLVKIS